MARETIDVVVDDCPRCQRQHTFSVAIDGSRTATFSADAPTIDLTLICPNTPTPPNDITVTVPRISLWTSDVVGDVGPRDRG